MNFGSFWIDSFLFVLGNVPWTMFQLNFLDKKKTNNKHQKPNKQTNKRKKDRRKERKKERKYKGENV